MLKELYKLYNYVIRMIYVVLTRRSQRSNLKWSTCVKLFREIYPVEMPKIKVNIWNYSI